MAELLSLGASISDGRLTLRWDATLSGTHHWRETKVLKRTLVTVVFVFGLIPLIALVWLWPRYDYLPSRPLPFRAERVSDLPIIHAGLSARLSEAAGNEDYVNINNPSLVMVPHWLPNPLGKYYLYFSHHKGDYIRMAYADSVTGPWTVYAPGTLTLEDSGFSSESVQSEATESGLRALWNNYSIYVVRDMLLLGYRASVVDPATRKKRGIAKAANSQPHIASPELIVDESNQRLLMYYHGLAGQVSQYTRIAESTDGLKFEPLPGVVGSNYLRAFSYDDSWYALTMPGILYRSADGVTGWEPRDRILFQPEMRHAGLWLRGHILYVFWSRVGDAPETILVSEVDLSPSDWNEWRATEPQELLRPELPWEGSELKVESSLRGEFSAAARELRDPFVFTDDDGRTYLLYTGAGEQAIGLARLVEDDLH